MLIAALLAASLLTKTSSLRSDQFFLRVAPSVSIESVAKRLNGIGRIERCPTAKSLFTVDVQPTVAKGTLKCRLHSLAGVTVLEPEEEPIAMNSVSSLDRKIRHLSSEGGDGEAGGLDYLEAYRYFVGQRAFPNDSIDWSQLSRARKHAIEMPSAFSKQRQAQPISGSFWQFVGPTNLQVPYRQYFGIGPVSGRVNAVAYDPQNPNILYAGGAQGGLWQSQDSGATWTWLSSTWNQLGVSCIAIDPTDSKTIYVGMGDYPGFISNSYGIMKSTDGGNSWSEIAVAWMGKVGVPKVLIDPTNHNVLLAGTGDQYTNGALYKSTDGGNTWTTVISNDLSQFRLWPTIASSLAVNGSVRMYAISAGWGNTTTPTSRFYVSDDHGSTWTAVPSPINTDGNFHRAYWVTASKVDPNRVYILDSENVALYSSDDRGSTWSNLSQYLPMQSPNFTQAWYNYYLETGIQQVGGSPADVLYLGEVDLNESLDGGHSWHSIGGPTYDPTSAVAHNDQHAFAVCPTDATKAIFSGDGGVYSLSYSPQTGHNTVVPLNKNLGVTMFYKIAAHPTNPQYLLGGTQDNASPLSTGDLGNWLNVGGGDGGGCAINPQNPLVAYVTAQPTNGIPYVMRTGDGWENFQSIRPPVTQSDVLAFVSPIVIDPSHPSNVYWGSNYLYRWSEDSKQWTARLGGQMLNAGPTTNGVIQAIAVAPSDSNTLYTGSSDGALWMSSDGGATWKMLSGSGSGLPNRSITAISVSPQSSHDILVGLAGSSSQHLWRCSNTASSSAPSFTSVSGNGPTSLPDASLNAIARDIDAPSTTWYVGTDVGLFRSTDAGTTWMDAGTTIGLPNCIIDDLVAVPGTRYLNCGTYGRGMWRLYLPVPPPPICAFTLTPSSVQGGASASGALVLTSPAPAGGVKVALTSSGDAVTVPASVTFPSGTTNVSFNLSTTGVPTTTQAVITALNGTQSLTQSLTVQATALSSVSIHPNQVVGGLTTRGTIQLSGIAPPAGMVVQLASSSSLVGVPTSVKVPSGSASTTFAISSTPVSTQAQATITATSAGSIAATLKLLPASIAAISVSPMNFVGSSINLVTGQITLSGPTTSAGVTILLSSSNTAALRVPSSIHVVTTGTNYTAPFSVVHSRVPLATGITLKATLGGQSVSGQVTVLPFLLSGFSIYPASVIGGTSTTATVDLNAVPTSRSGSIVVALHSNSKAAQVPASISFSAATGGERTFAVKTLPQKSDSSAVVSASLDGASQSATILVVAPVLAQFSITPATVVGSSGVSATGKATLSGPAPTGGLSITLVSSDPTHAIVPQKLVIPAGHTYATFTIRHKRVSSSETVVLTASSGAVILSRNLILTP